MSTCIKSSDFKKYFEQNMQALGLTVPANLFETFEKAVSTASLLIGSLRTLGPGATVTELAGATIGLEKLLVVGSLGAAYYAGAVIGSTLVASARTAGCSASIVDLAIFVHQNKLAYTGWERFFALHPQVLDWRNPNRKDFAVTADVFGLERAPL